MITLKKLSNGFEYLEVNNASAKAKIALNGAHVFEYKREGFEDLLWLSETSEFKLGSSIRGGVPICWPAFGSNNPSLSQHGFARTSLFTLVDSNEANEGSTEISLRLTHSDETLALWKHKFELNLKITISDELSLEMQTINLGDEEFTITQAFHAYFNVSNISDVGVGGLDDKPYFDALSGETRTQIGDVRFNAEFDSVYQEVDNDVVLKDKNRVVRVRNEGSSSMVVWNPWIEKGARMSGMRADAYKEFVCLESANAYEDFKIIKPGESHTLKTVFTAI